MGSASRILVASALLSATACGGFLGLTGDDAEPGPPAVADAAADASTSTGANDGSSIGDGASIVDATSDHVEPDASPDCLTSSCPKRVFVTQAAFTGDLGGVAGADAKCQAAGNAFIPGRQWKAWLSAAKDSVKARFPPNSSSEYVTGFNLTVAVGWPSFASATHLSRIMDEMHQPPPGNDDTWTGTQPNGDAMGVGSDCNGWTSADATANGVTGNAEATGEKWTNAEARDCSQEAHLYCVEL